MDFMTIIGLLGTLVTFEEAGRGWFPTIKNQKVKNKINLSNWDSNDPAIQHTLDSFKADVRAEYKEHIFSESEMNEIVKKFLDEKSYLNLYYEDKKKIAEYIQDILNKYNEYTRSMMSIGEKVLYERTVSDNDEMKSKLSVIENKEHLNNLARFYEAVEISKNVGLSNIECLINDEYEIDRSAIIEKIQKADERFISIQGCAGSGKSVIGKKLVEAEQFILYARAERFIQEKNISDIWQCNLVEALDEISEYRVVFFIDALEFIADCSADRVELLQSLYNIVAKYNNVYVITTCRTEDRNAFLKLQTKYSIRIYEIEDVSKGELNGICQKYPILKKMREQKAYADLLKSPFYINLIVSRMPDADNIQDENAFRDYIWRNIICLEDKAAKYGVSSDELRYTIENISFTRAKQFLIGVHRSEIKKKVLHILITEGVIIQKGEYVRLKYDIFEDICFEHYFDKSFDTCKGNFQAFFSTIESIGRCVYRRYQIWISNKLFLQKNREKFIYVLIFNNCISEKWKNQTEIGIVKSKYCANFFEEYFHDLVYEGHIDKIIHIINLYAFEAQITETNSDEVSLDVTPVGKARECFIILLHRNWNEFMTVLDKAGVLRVCEDYAKQENKNKDATVAACAITECYIEQIMNNRYKGWYYDTTETLMPLLKIVYMMADASDEWIRNFFENLLHSCKSKDDMEVRWARKIIEETLKNTYPVLARMLPKELCNLADNLWFVDSANERGINNVEATFGLSEYSMSYHNIYEVLFLRNIFKEQFRVGFDWAIQFINRAIQNYAVNYPEYVDKVAIYFSEEKNIREYYGNLRMWMFGINEHSQPVIIGDIVYILKSVLIETIEEYANNKADIESLAEMVKSEIYTQSNNVVLLTIIEAIGMNFQRELPGYALDLAANFDLLYWDLKRYALYDEDPDKKISINRSLKRMGLPALVNRYELDEKCNINLQQYVLYTQILHGGEVCKKCDAICDYLYSQTCNEGEEAQNYLQIKKMDFRDVSIKEIAEDTYAVMFKVTGEAERIFRHQEEVKAQSPKKKINELIAQSSGVVNDDKIDQKTLNEVLDLIIETAKKDERNWSEYEYGITILIPIALDDKEMCASRREYLCDIWINSINELFNQYGLSRDIKLTYILFEQLQNDVSLQIRNRIKKLLLNCILYKGHNTLIYYIAAIAKLYLQIDKHLAGVVFNTVMMLAENGLNPQVYDEVIAKYLFEESEVEEDSFDIDRYDIQILCYISICGLDFSDKKFEEVVKGIVHGLINLWNSAFLNRETYCTVDSYSTNKIMEFFRREIVYKDADAEKAIDILFDDIDFTLFASKAIHLYQDIFTEFGRAYFDGYSDKDKRRMLENKILYLDEKVNRVKNDYARIQLYKSLMLLPRVNHGQDWSEDKTEYSYSDIMFLNGRFRKYGKYYVTELLQTIYQLQMEKLTPHILISLNEVFADALNEDKVEFAKSIDKVQWIIDRLIFIAFVYQSDAIKNDDELTVAFEGVLQSLIELDNPKAAVILDEFRVH